MADQKISDLNAVVTIADADILPLVDASAGETKNMTALQFKTYAAGGDVFKVGTPVNNQLGIWTGDGTLEGVADLTYDGAGALLYSFAQDGLTELKVENTSGAINSNTALRVNNFNGGISIQAKSPSLAPYANHAVILVDGGMNGLAFDVKDPINFYNTVSGSVIMLSMDNTAVVVNPGLADMNFRVSGTTDANLLFANPSANRLQVGTSTNLGGAGIKFLVDGVTAFTEVAAPVTPAAGFVSIYAKADRKLYIKDSTGLETDLTNVGGGGGDVTKVGTPVNDQLGVWTGDGTIQGDASLTWDGSTLAISGALNVNGAIDSAIETVTDDTLDATNSFVVVDTAAAPRTINLPAVAGVARRIYQIRNNGSAGNNVTIDPDGAETINGAATFVLSDGESATIICDGATWFTF